MKIRIGIDVGGTFTDAVAINEDTLDILGFVKVLTTHKSKNGVSDGIVLAISNLISKYNIKTCDISFISTGTTQATNAILEGDVYPVGVVVITNRKRYSIKNISLNNKNYINIKTYIVKPDSNFESNLKKIILKINSDNINSIVASCPFSPDNPTFEKKVLDIAKKYDIYATATYDISKLYGIKIRTSTAIINASILPKMVTTFNMIKTSIQNMGISAPIMIMRCDGGVMPLDEVLERPFLTILSGPAAGVYGALIHEKISSGIFLEVGGTSTDISVIKNGNVMLKHAQIGKHKLYLNSLDIHTIAVAGGSMIKLNSNNKLDVGPRSAHILGLKYSCFCNPDSLNDSKIVLLESGYLGIKNPNGEIFAITLTCILNALGLLNYDDYSFGNIQSAKIAVSILANFLNTSIQNIANKILQIAVFKCTSIINNLTKQYGIKNLILFGGGGACGTLVPFIAKKIHCKYKICKNAPIISTIGVSLSAIREVIEKTVFDPTQKDIENLKKQAISKIKNSTNSIRTYVEFDKNKNILRVIATSSTKRIHHLSKLELTKIISTYISCDESLICINKQIGKYFIFNATITQKFLFTLIRKKKKIYIVIDSFGIIRCIKTIKKLYIYSNSVILNVLNNLLIKYSNYSDIGRLLPKCLLITPDKIIDLSNFSDMSKILSFAKSEIDFSKTFDIAILIG